MNYHKCGGVRRHIRRVVHASIPSAACAFYPSHNAAPGSCRIARLTETSVEISIPVAEGQG
jgi:hypothetical protein